MKEIVGSFVSALLLATLTAVVTLILLIVLSWALGGEARARAEQSRCYAALTNAMLHDLLDEAGIVNDYPRVDRSGVDCSFLEEPIE